MHGNLIDHGGRGHERDLHDNSLPECQHVTRAFFRSKAQPPHGNVVRATERQLHQCKPSARVRTLLPECTRG